MRTPTTSARREADDDHLSDEALRKSDTGTTSRETASRSATPANSGLAPPLSVIAAILVVGALKLAAPVALPLALAILLLALVWPLQKNLEDRLPRGTSTLIAMTAVLGLIAAFVATLIISTNMIADRLPAYNSVAQERYGALLQWADDQGIPYEPSREDFQAAAGRALSVFGSGVQGVYSLVGRLVLALLFLLFGLLEIPSFYRKLDQSPKHSPGAKLLQASKVIGRRYRQYMWTKAFTSALTALGTVIVCWGLGVDLAFVWGLLAFLLNFIPNIGSIIAVIPPTLLAFLQFDDAWSGVAVVVGLTAVQVVIGSYVDPRLQGKNLKLSPFVVLLSIVFWGWVWGVVGALVGVPMTVAVVALGRHFERTAWVATILADVPSHGDDSYSDAKPELLVGK